MDNRRRTRGEVEAEFTKAVIKFEREQLGRGPGDARTYLLGDMVLVRLRGMLTPAELKLSESREARSSSRRPGGSSSKCHSR